jgi:hypothetical protein
MNLLNTKSLKTTSLISTGLIVASLALTGNAAMAANLPVHKAAATTHVVHPRVAHVVARRPGPPAQLGFDVGGFIQAMFGGSLPPQYAQIVQNALRGAASHKYAGSAGSARDTGGYDPAFDSPSPPVDVGPSHAAGGPVPPRHGRQRCRGRTTKRCGERRGGADGYQRRHVNDCRHVKRHVKRHGRRPRAGALRILLAQSAWRSRREPRGAERAEITITQGLEPPPFRRDQQSEATAGARWRSP